MRWIQELLFEFKKNVKGRWVCFSFVGLWWIAFVEIKLLTSLFQTLFTFARILAAKIIFTVLTPEGNTTPYQEVRAGRCWCRPRWAASPPAPTRFLPGKEIKRNVNEFEIFYSLSEAADDNCWWRSSWHTLWPKSVKAKQASVHFQNI